MRTPVDLPDELHRQVRAIARETQRTSRSPRTGLPIVSLGTVVTTEDVRSLDDGE